MMLSPPHHHLLLLLLLTLCAAVVSGVPTGQGHGHGHGHDTGLSVGQACTSSVSAAWTIYLRVDGSVVHLRN